MTLAEVNGPSLHYRFDGPEQGPVVDATIDRWFIKAGQERLHAEVEAAFPLDIQG